MRAVPRSGRRMLARATMLAAALSVCLSAAAHAQQAASRFLAKEDIYIYGIGLKVEPATQTVPRDIATIVSTYLQAPTDPEVPLPPFAPNAVVRATLRGPSFATPLELTANPNTPFDIPPLTVPGIHTLDDIRLVSNGEVLLRGVPESATITVIKELLVTQVTARPLSAAEIRERGIVFDKSSFQAYNFTAAFAVQGVTVNLDFPVLLPQLAGAQDVRSDRATIPTITTPGLQNLRTIIPDTLQIQRQVPNLSVVGFSLKIPAVESRDLIVPPIPGVIVFPGNIAFLNQFMSVLLMVSNVAPEGSNLVVSDLNASIVLPAGRDTVVNSTDDPLIMARTAAGETPRLRAVTQPGPDGQLGTADDIVTLGPGQTGHAEYLVEGRREGSHVVEMELEGTLHGLPVGPVTIRGRAAGAVLVRNPTYTLTFIHPEIVSAGEPYSLDVSVTNTSESPANFVSVNLLARNISGAMLTGEAAKEIESIPPGDTATVSFELISLVTGKVTAATLDSDAQIAGRFELKHAVGELGVPLSPESLVLPKEASTLPKSLRDATLGLLGKAWAVATAPAAALPRDVKRFSRQMVIDMAVAAAEAGLRVSLGEPLRDSATHLGMDLFGSLFARLPELNPKPADRDFAETNYIGFDDLRRRSVRGEVFAQAVADLLNVDLGTLGVSAFHGDLARKVSFRPAHVSVLAGTSGAVLPVSIVLVDSEGRRLGGTNDQGRIVKDIPFGDTLIFKNAGGDRTAQLSMLVAPPAGEYTLRLEPVVGTDADTPFSLSLVVPRADGSLRQITFATLTRASLPTVSFATGDPYRIAIVGDPGSTAAASTTDTILDDPAPWVIGVIQQAEADRICDATGPQAGRVVAVLFSEEVTRESVQDKFKAEDITNYAPEANRVVSVALQPGRRIAFLALRDPFGPFVPRTITISGVADRAGQAMAAQTLSMVSTLTEEGGVVSGRVLDADGTPIPFASVRLFTSCPPGAWQGISAKTADEQGRFSWDFVIKRHGDRVLAVEPETEEFRDFAFTVQRHGQRLSLDLVMLGRGTFTGRTLSETGAPLRNTSVRITSQTDSSQYGVTTDANGAFTIARIPVGTVLVEAVNTTQRARTFLTEIIPFAGATTTRDIVLLNVESPAQVVVKRGAVRGHVLRADNQTPVANVPVILYYTSGSQPGVVCSPGECPIALVNTDGAGAFSFPDVTAGRLRAETFDQGSLQKGEASFVLPANGAIEANVILSGGLGVVRGVVLDPEGRGVAGVRVGGGLSLVTTDANGQFTLPDVPVGRASIVAVSDALQSKGNAEVDVVRAGEEVNVAIVLESTGGVAGIIRSSTGQPVPNLTVYLFEAVGGGIVVKGTATTDDQGAYSIGPVPIGEYQVSAFRTDFSDGNIEKVAVKFSGQVSRRDVTFRGGGGTVTGRLLDDDGVTPLKGRLGLSGEQLVIAGGKVGVRFQHVANFAITDSDFTTGQFTLRGLWVGPFTLRAAGQFSPDPVALEGTMPAAGATVQMDIRLQPTSQITGRVLQPDGVTAAGANLIVTYKSDEVRVICSENAAGETSCTAIPQGIQEEIVVTDAEGRFGLPLVNAGTFTVTVEDPATGKTGRAKGSVRAGETIDIDVRLIGRGEVTVRVRGSDAVTPIPGAKVDIAQLDFPGRKLTRFADNQGVVVIGGGDALTEGAFVVTATDLRNGFAGRASGAIAHDGEQITTNVFLFNQSGVVYGTVFKSDGITAVPNAEVVVSNSGGPIALTVTDAAGAYRIELVPLGPVTVGVFEAATARRGSATGQIFADGQEVPINVSQAALGVVRGTVLDAGSLAPLKAWLVRLSQTAPDGRGLPSLAAMSSVDGTFSFSGVSQGAVSLSAVREGVNGSGTASTAIQREGHVVDVPILAQIIRPLFGHIQGRVLTPDGQPAPNAQVDVCGGACGGSTPATALTDATGGFVLENLPLRRYEVRARAQGSPNSGSAFADLLFDGETVAVVVPLIGLSQVDGQVVRGDGSPAPFAEVQLDAVPRSGCATSCVKFADANGNFSFTNLPARSFTITAADPVSGLKGAVGDTLTPGSVRTVRIVLEPTGSVSGRVLRQNLSPASGVTAELVVNGQTLYKQTAADGTFTFGTTRLGPYTLELEDPTGSGIATRVGQISGALGLGDIRLDEAPPAVASTTPAALATAVPLDATVRIVFTEPVNAGTVNAMTVALTDDEGVVAATLALGTGDTVATLTPLEPLSESTRYAVRVKGVKDLVGKTMAADHVTTFTTVDLTPPAHLDVSPAPGANGVPIYTTVRLKFSEPIDPTKTAQPAILLTGPGGPVEGRLDFSFGNTVAIFTPARPLAEDAVYRVQTPATADLAGNVQPQGLDYTFGTTDRTPPQILQLVAPASVIENGIASVIADVGTTHDVGFVDFFVNGVFAAVARSTPFTLQFQAVPSLGAVGDAVTVIAIATDTSGNRGAPSAPALLTIALDQPPTVTIAAPPDGLTARNGDRIVVQVRAVDDLGVTQQGYKAQTGQPQDTALKGLSPARTDHTESFAFHVPLGAAPGSTILVEASAADTKGQIGQASPIRITVLDSVAPVVAITGVSTGDAIRPGQQTTVVVSAQDLGGVTTIDFSTTGILTVADARTIDPAQNNTLASFTFQVPNTARPGDSITLRATATDRAANVGTAASVVLPVADTVAPTAVLRTTTGSLNMVPGTTVNVIVDAIDSIGVSRVELTGSGAFVVTDAKQVAPPTGDAHVTFTIAVPPAVAPGDVLNLQARAVDLAGNVSSPAFLSLVGRELVEITLPGSAIVAAGESVDVEVQLASGAPAAGQLVTFATGSATVATVPASVVFAAGETTRTIQVTGVAGGTTSLRAFVQGVERADMTIVVQGGIVDGIVFDSALNPAPNVQVTVSGGYAPVETTTDAAGRYRVTGVVGGQVTVRALDPVSLLRGFATASMNRDNGFAHVNVVLIPAGSIAGTVRLPDGQTSAGAGVRVDIYAASNFSIPVATTFTDDAGRYEFPLVTLGSYRIDASAVDGGRGRSNASVVASGQEILADITFLGRGTVSGTVLNAGGQPVSNATLTFSATSLFGSTTVTRSAELDGTFTFGDVPVGTFTLTARDPITNRAAAASGSIANDGQQVQLTLTVASYGTVRGTVFRADGVTPVADALVFIAGVASTTTNTSGEYEFPVLSLGAVTVVARESSTRGVGSAAGTLTANGQTLTLNVTFIPQGTVVGTVIDADSAPVAGAFFQVSTQAGGFQDAVSGLTDADGQVILPHVLAGTLTFSATKATLGGTAPSRTLAPGEVAEVTVRLEPTASIAGVVYAPDGQTPQSTGSVSIVRFQFGGWLRLVTTPLAADGSFRFDGLKLAPETYQLGAYDVSNRLRALVKTPITLTANGEVAERNMTFIGLGTVSGRVINPNGSSAPNFSVQVKSLTPDFGGVGSATSNAAGFYQVNNVAVGSIAVTTGNTTLKLLGEAFGTLGGHGQTLTLDVLLQSNAINLPRTLYDANAAPFDIGSSGSVRQGLGFTFLGNDAQGASHLEIVNGGVATPFTGSEIGTLEDSGREVATRELNLAGLDVTRKIFVPSTGYFARYLELLTNSTGSPITVDLRLTTHIRANQATDVIATSSGDDELDASDRWVTVDDGDSDPFLGGSNAPLAFTFDGAGATDGVDATAFTSTKSCSFCVATSHLSYEWTAVTIPPGATVAYLHFVTQQVNRPGALASAERLVQLPPEALAGLSPEEMTAIANFVIPADGQSALAPLPALNGTVTGRLYEHDGATVTPSATLVFRSSHPLFGRRVSGFTGSGQFSITANLSGDSGQTVVPVDGFTITGTHGSTQVVSPPVSGTFIDGETVAAADVVFSNTGMLAGRLLRAGGQPVSSGSLHITDGISLSLSVAAAADGSFLFRGLPPGSKTLTASSTHPQGVAASSVTPVVTNAAETRTFDVFLPPLGGVTGIVRNGGGAVVVNTTVRLQNTFGSFWRQTTTDSSGRYTLTDVPVGSYTVSVTEPISQTPTTVNVTIVADTVITHDLTFIGLGTVSGTVRLASGAAVSGSTVQLYAAGSPFVLATQATNASGVFTFANRPVNRSYRVRAYNPAQGTQYRETTDQLLSTHGQTLTLNVTLPAQATVRVTVRRPDTTPFANARVEIKDAFDAAFRSQTNADANGVVLFPNVAEGTFTVQARDPGTNSVVGTATGSVALANNGQTIDVVLNTGLVLPWNLFDGNNSRFDVQANGSLADGQNDAFNGGALLYVPGQFPGVAFAGVEENNRELVLTQNNFGGLDVTRKIYVPADGYFGRYLEILRNPGAAPVTIDVSVLSFLGSGSQTRILATSSGDTTFGIDDQWLVSDDDGVATASGDPTVAFAFAGPGGRGLSTATMPSSGQASMLSSWDDITIDPGQTVILMHFVVQQPQMVDAGAIAAMQRLVQLPPEALAGLSAEERAQIINWVVPADGSSPLPPIPPQNGSIVGRVFAADGVTNRVGAVVRYRNDSYPFLNNSVRAVTNGSTGYFINQVFNAPFTLQATEVTTLALSPLLDVAFPQGQTSVTQNIVFSNTGIVRGRVLRGGVGVSAGISLDGSGSFNTFSSTNGEYVLYGVLPGVHTLSASGGGATGVTPFNIAAGQTLTGVDIVIAAGTISGRVTRANGTPVGSAAVALLNPDGSVYLNAVTDVGGFYGFSNIPLNREFFVRSVFPGFASTFTTTAAPVVVTADLETVTANVTLIPFATVTLTVVDVNGTTPIGNAAVDLQRQPPGGAFQFMGRTNGNGQLTIAGVTAPAFALRVSDDYGQIGAFNGLVDAASDGTTLTPTIAATSLFGFVRGTLYAADGLTEMPDYESGGLETYIQVLDATTQTWLADDYDDTNYRMGFTLPLPGQFIVRAHSPLDWDRIVEAHGQFTRRYDEVTRDLTLPVGVVTGTVRTFQGDAVPYPNVTLRRIDTPDGGTLYPTRADEQGRFGIIVLDAGEYLLTAQDPESGVAAIQQVSVTDATVAIDVGDVHLPETIFFSGQVVDTNFDAVASATVGITIASPFDITLSASTDEFGTFYFQRMPTGPFRVQACHYVGGEARCGSAMGTATAFNSFVFVQTSGIGEVNGVVFEADGSRTPLASVTVYQWDYEGPIQYAFQKGGNADGGGFSVNEVPSGPIVVTARNRDTGAVGMATGVLFPNDSTTIEVTLGNAVEFDEGTVELNSVDYRNDFRCDGAINSGGPVGGGSPAFNRGQFLDLFTIAAGVSGDRFPCRPYAALDAGGRQITIDGGYRARSGLRVSRKMYAPEWAPSFVRYVEELANPTDVDITVRVRMSGSLAGGSVYQNVFDPGVAVLIDSTQVAPSVGLVFGPTDSSAPVTGTFSHSWNDYAYEWVVTIPAGETRRLMHFVLQADPVEFDYFTLYDLASLVQFDALVGLSAEERASIVNFVVPQ